MWEFPRAKSLGCLGIQSGWLDRVLGLVDGCHGSHGGILWLFTTTQAICKINFPGTHTFLSRLDFYGEKKRHAVQAVRNSRAGRIRGRPICTKDKVMQLENADLQSLQRQVEKRWCQPV